MQMPLLWSGVLVCQCACMRARVRVRACVRAYVRAEPYPGPDAGYVSTGLPARLRIRMQDTVSTGLSGCRVRIQSFGRYRKDPWYHASAGAEHLQRTQEEQDNYSDQEDD